jgi:glycolate oxidase FAD binding subunit
MDIVLSTLRLKKVTDNDCENLTLSAESGMTLREVQKILAKEGRGYFLPLDPPYSREATLGGIVVTNSSGPKRLLYGTARDLIIGTKAVFPNGDIVVSGGKTVKNVSGYDMCKLLIGSYGTLGILCEMTFRLLPLPEKEATLLIPFAKLEEADGFVRELIGSQLIPTSIETLNPIAVKKMKYSMPTSNGYYLVAIGLEGVSEAVERQVSDISDIGKRYGALKAEVLDTEQQDIFWTAFRDFSKGLSKTDPGSVSLRANFLISKRGEMLGSFEKMTKESGIDCGILSHCGSGILYVHLLPGKHLREKSDAVVELIGKLTAQALKNEGNLVIESAPLAIKKKVDVWGQSRDDYRVVRRLKEQIDPAGIFNPGRFIGGI